MPFNKTKLAEMTATGEEFIDIGEIAKRCGVTERSIERVIEKHHKRLKKSRKRSGRKFVYLWSDALMCVKDYLGIKKTNVPSVTTKRDFTKQRVKALEAEVERQQLKNARIVQLLQDYTIRLREDEAPESIPF